MEGSGVSAHVPRLTLGSQPGRTLIYCWGVGGVMDEATCKAAGEEAWRQIDHPCSFAFQELRPRGGWRHGSIFWIVAQSQCRVCGVELLPHPPQLQREKYPPSSQVPLAPAAPWLTLPQRQLLGVGGSHQVHPTAVTGRGAAGNWGQQNWGT